MPNLLKSIFAIVPFALVLGAGCSGVSEPPAASTVVRPTPITDGSLHVGWNRVQVRSGLIGRYGDDSHVGFTVDLPQGWSAGESWPGISRSAWIAAPQKDGDDISPIFRIRFDIDFSRLSEDIEQQSAYRSISTSIEDATVIWTDLADGVSPRRIQSLALFDRLPGTPNEIGETSFTVFVEPWDFFESELIREVLSTIKYQKLDVLPELSPVPDIDSSSWKTVSGKSPFPGITMRVPDHWNVLPRRGIDTLVGDIDGDGIAIYYDFGNAASAPLGPGTRQIIAGTVPDHFFWEEQIAGESFWLIRPASTKSDPDAITGMWSDRLPGSADNLSILSMVAFGLSADQQELALAVFRTVRNAAYEEAGE
ncbi:MAG: hypothetical protein HQ478_03705 [Chloroflexi bacterium]|nr:hypothetical protein [Chloroflexota bacterium]